MLHAPAERNLRLRGPMLLRDTHQRVVRQQRRHRARRRLPNGRVRSQHNLVALAKRAERHARQARVQLHLVDGGHDVGGLEQGGEEGDAKVGHAQRPHLARVEQLDHVGPGLVDRRALVGLQGLAVLDTLRPVHQVQINVLNVQGLEGALKGLGHAVVVGVVPEMLLSVDLSS